MKNKGNTALAFILGAAAGAVVGILLAPDKGSETRRKLAESAGSVSDLIKEKASQGMQSMSDLKDTVVEKAQDFMGKSSVNSNGHA